MASVHKIVFTFDTDTSSSFAFGVSNTTDDPLNADLQKVAQGIVSGNTVVPKTGSVTKLNKIERVSTTTTNII